MGLTTTQSHVSMASQLTADQWAIVLPEGDLRRRHRWVPTPVFAEREPHDEREADRIATLDKMRWQAQSCMPADDPPANTPDERDAAEPVPIASRYLVELRHQGRNGVRP